MDKKLITIISTDWHLKPSNCDLVKKLVEGKVNLALQHKIDTIFVTGDVFDDRISQRMIVLKTFLEICQYIESHNIKMIVIPGNHDKTDYTLDDSFLDIFDSKYCQIIREPEEYGLGMLDVLCVPFYREDVWNEKLKYFKDSKFNLLLTHTAFNGSINNDKNVVESVVNSKKIKKQFDLVLSGHYHDYQQVSEGVYHIPSLYQNNFGESNNKGYTLLYDDLSFDFIKSDFPEFINISIDCKLDKDNIDIFTEKYKNSKDNIRFTFVGSNTELKSIDTIKYRDLGIDVRKINVDNVIINTSVSNEIKVLDIETIKKKFQLFCTKEGLNYEQGLKYLQDE